MALLICTGLMFTLVFQSCTPSMATDSNEKETDKIPVHVAEIIREEIAIPVRISGSISPSKESRLSFKTGGIIREIRVNEGDKVKKGALLAQLDLKEINQQVLQAEVAYQKAYRDFNRTSNLYRDTVATLQQLQNAKSALEVAQANVNIANYNLRHSSIYAPADGIILKKFMEENEITGTGTPVFYFAPSDDNWRMVVGVTDKNIVNLTLDNRATIFTDAYPNHALRAEVSKIANAPEINTGLYEVELSVDANDLKLKPGFFARGDIMPSEKVACSKFPVDAVNEGIGRKVSFFLYDDKLNLAIRAEGEVIFLDEDYVYVNAINHDTISRVITRAPAVLKHLDAVKEALPSTNFQALNTQN